MKAWQWHWSVVLLAATVILPAGLRAQEAPPAPPAPPEQPVWVGQMAGNALAQAGNGLDQVLMTPSADEGWLGVSISEVTTAEAQQAKLSKLGGVYVNNVETESPAAKAGVQSHDIIVEYNGHAVEGVLQFRRLVRETPPERSVSMRVWRAGRQQTLSAKVDRRRMLFESSMPARERIRIERTMGGSRGVGMHPLLGVRAQEVRQGNGDGGFTEPIPNIDVVYTRVFEFYDHVGRRRQLRFRRIFIAKLFAAAVSMYSDSLQNYPPFLARTVSDFLFSDRRSLPQCRVFPCVAKAVALPFQVARCVRE